MIRKLICAAIVLGLSAGVSLADVRGDKEQTKQGKVVKVAENKIIFVPYEATTKKFGKEIEVPVAGDTIKVFLMTDKGQKEPLAGGLKGKELQTPGKDGTYATLRMKGDTVVEIVLFPDEATWQKSLLKAPTGVKESERPERIPSGS
jgi:hypothetical protein